jgi:hypothetical protein
MSTPFIKNTLSRTMLLYYETVEIDGIGCRKEFSELIRNTKQKRFYNRAHEWCCGHGAIGFQLLEDGLCANLVLTDKHPPATQGCEFTVCANDLKNNVTVYCTDDLANLPESEQWDLFVANPPWRSKFLPGPAVSDDIMRKMFDVDWKTHDILWKNIDKYTTHDADIYLYEDVRFSNVDTWKDQIAQANLKVHDVHYDFNLVNSPTAYVMHLVKNT